MRRPYIYPHRSLRFVPIPATRVIVGVAAAVVLCAVTAFRGTDLLVAHARLCGLLLRLAGIPVEGTQTIGVFGGLGPVHSPALGAVLWALGMQAYAYLWSAVRLTFCLGVAYYTGTLFLLLLWFSLGVLADLLYILVFYSVVVHQACGRWGRRASWQY